MKTTTITTEEYVVGAKKNKMNVRKLIAGGRGRSTVPRKRNPIFVDASDMPKSNNIKAWLDWQAAQASIRRAEATTPKRPVIETDSQLAAALLADMRNDRNT